MHKKKYKRFLILCLAVICAILIFNYRYVPILDKKLLVAPSSGSIIPVGEINKDFYLIQDVLIDRIIKIIPSKPGNIVCLRILLANYSNRNNLGELGFIVQLDDAVHEAKINAADVKDNLKHRICFNDLTTEYFLKSKDIKIVVHGISSETGSSVTAWAGTNISVGKIKSNDNPLLTDRSLIFDIVSVGEKDNKKIHAIIIALFGMLAVSTLFIPNKDQG